MEVALNTKDQRTRKQLLKENAALKDRLKAGEPPRAQVSVPNSLGLSGTIGTSSAQVTFAIAQFVQRLALCGDTYLNPDPAVRRCAAQGAQLAAANLIGALGLPSPLAYVYEHMFNVLKDVESGVEDPMLKAGPKTAGVDSATWSARAYLVASTEAIQLGGAHGSLNSACFAALDALKIMLPGSCSLDDVLPGQFTPEPTTMDTFRERLLGYRKQLKKESGGEYVAQLLTELRSVVAQLPPEQRTVFGFTLLRVARDKLVATRDHHEEFAVGE